MGIRRREFLKRSSAKRPRMRSKQKMKLASWPWHRPRPILRSSLRRSHCANDSFARKRSRRRLWNSRLAPRRWRAAVGKLSPLQISGRVIIPLTGHIRADGRLRDHKSELAQFALNSRHTPNWVLLAHAAGQCPQPRADWRPACQRARFPTPFVAKSCTMPAHSVPERSDGYCVEDLRVQCE